MSAGQLFFLRLPPKNLFSCLFFQISKVIFLHLWIYPVYLKSLNWSISTKVHLQRKIPYTSFPGVRIYTLAKPWFCWSQEFIAGGFLQTKRNVQIPSQLNMSYFEKMKIFNSSSEPQGLIVHSWAIHFSNRR